MCERSETGVPARLEGDFDLAAMLFTAVDGRRSQLSQNSEIQVATSDAHHDMICLLVAAGAFAPAGRPTLQLRSAAVRPLSLRPQIRCAAAAVPLPEDGEAAASPPPASTDEGASFTTTTFNICKAALGAGVLSLPSGVARMGDVPAALWPASALVIGLGVISAYTFSLTARVCDANDAETLGSAWEKAIGKDSAWVVPSALAALCLGVCAAYGIILGDTFSALAQTAGATGFAATRHASILLSAAALLPLCSLKSLAALAPSSIIGVLGVFVSGGFLWRRWAQRAYAAGGAYALSIAPALRPSFGVSGMRPLFPSSLILISMVAVAYQAHFSAPACYSGLQDKSIAKFNKVTVVSFGIICAVTVAMMAVAFLTFGGASSGLILNNYATADAGAALSRLLMGFAVMGGYPLLFAVARDALSELFPALVAKRATVTRALLAVLTAIGLVVSDVGFIVSFIGAVLGSGCAPTPAARRAALPPRAPPPSPTRPRARPPQDHLHLPGAPLPRDVEGQVSRRQVPALGLPRAPAVPRPRRARRGSRRPRRHRLRPRLVHQRPRLRQFIPGVIINILIFLIYTRGPSSTSGKTAAFTGSTIVGAPPFP